ncbi:MAG TPA: PIN domain-containing protein [Dehalococcoidia bacterium]|nr:PIN domain-containing protein [Dehalococcoidia bacterium]
MGKARASSSGASRGRQRRQQAACQEGASCAHQTATLITLDTSAVVALLDRDDQNHRAAEAFFRQGHAPNVIPAAILSEIAYMTRSRLAPDPIELFIADIEQGVYSLDCGEQDLPRIRELVGRYDNLPLGLADAAVIACAERNGERVMTFDRRDFDIVAREGRIRVEP